MARPSLDGGYLYRDIAHTTVREGRYRRKSGYRITGKVDYADEATQSAYLPGIDDCPPRPWHLRHRRGTPSSFRPAW